MNKGSDAPGSPWRLFGRKIYISWGDHDFADNIVHLVLARTPDAPEGLKGISSSSFPKKIPGPDGKLVRNDIRAFSLEHKMGIRASPTCSMVLGRERRRARLAHRQTPRRADVHVHDDEHDAPRRGHSLAGSCGARASAGAHACA